MTFGGFEMLRQPGVDLAVQVTPGTAPGVLWCGGFRSDMTGTKAQALADWAAQAGVGFTRFDYRGHGQSTGRFEDACIGDWRADALAVIDQKTTGPLVLVGSSMGGWIGLLAALARPERIKALVLIAPAPDFTHRLLEPSLPAEARAALAADGVWHRPSAYGDGPYAITRHLLQEGRQWALLDQPIPLTIPVHILHGQADEDVPWSLSLELAAQLAGGQVTVTFIKAGDHRLSTPADLARLIATVAQARAEVAAA